MRTVGVEPRDVLLRLPLSLRRPYGGGLAVPAGWPAPLDLLAGIATEDETEHLDLEPGSPVLHISRRAFCRENVVEVTRSVYRADRYTLWVPVRRPEHLR